MDKKPETEVYTNADGTIVRIPKGFNAGIENTPTAALIEKLDESNRALQKQNVSDFGVKPVVTYDKE